MTMPVAGCGDRPPHPAGGVRQASRAPTDGAYSAAVWTPSPRRRGALVLTGLTLAVALTTTLSGCGSGGSSGGNSAGSSADDGGTVDTAAFCKLLGQQLPAYATDPLKALPATAGASEWKAYFDVTHRRNAELVAAAPNELSEPLTGLQTANDQLSAFYAEAEYDAAQLDPGALNQVLHDAGYSEAVATVTGYARNTCKIDVPAAGG